MRRKSVLSHSPRLFPTFYAVAFLITPALNVAMPSVSWAQSVATNQATTLADKDLATTVQAEQISGRPERYIQFDYDVSVNNGETSFKANSAVFRQLDERFEAKGNVSITRKGGCYRGDELQLKLDTGEGFISHPSYELKREDGQQAQGRADRIDFLSQERSTITNGTYSTCQGLDPDWYLKADTLELDTGLDKGVASGSVVFFKNVPILATPSFLPLSFPLSGARQSGLLPPVYSSSSSGGLELTLPYYFNIAPNRDLTFSPKWIARRGTQLGVEGRYLGETYAGDTYVEGLFNDQQTKTNRYWVDSKHIQNLSTNLNLNWNVKAASDDNYSADFFDSIAKTSQRLLLRDVNLVYTGSFWNLGLRASNYQVLQDVTDPIARPYDRLPQLSFHAEKQEDSGLNWSVDSTVTRFWNPSLVSGDRAVFAPEISWPLLQPGYFVVPKLSLNATSYHLSNVAPGNESDFHRVVPTFSVDSGLVFERATDLFDQKLTQTLEPRLFYVNTPYRDQSKLPLFDTADADFNFAQIFNENRFSGQDRIGDANQVTAAITSRFIEDDGTERFKFAVGQRFYFNTQKVTLNNTSNPSRSDILLASAGRITSNLSVDAALQMSQSDRQSVRANYGISWQPAPKSVINAEYRFQRGSLEQVALSSQWPIAKRWYAVGRTNYSLLDKKLVDGLAGFEYKDDCWSLRFVGQRFAANTNSSPTHFFIMLELNGLSKLGSNPLEVLKKSITGYQSIN